MVLKIVAWGLIAHRNSYLREGWNIIDLCVVTSGILELLFGSVKLKALRVLRVLRPLKTVNSIPSLRMQVVAMIQSLPDFLNVEIFMFFILILFAIFGMQEYSGITYNRCRLTPHPLPNGSWPLDMSNERLCSVNGQGTYKCPIGTYCGNPSMFEDAADDNIMNLNSVNYGITTFDNIGKALLTVTVMITESWYKFLMNMMDTDQPLLGVLFSVLLLIIGAILLMNLITAVIIQAFLKASRQQLEERFHKELLPKWEEDSIFDEEQEDFAKNYENLEGGPRTIQVKQEIIDEEEVKDHHNEEERNKVTTTRLPQHNDSTITPGLQESMDRTLQFEQSFTSEEGFFTQSLKVKQQNTGMGSIVKSFKNHQTVISEHTDEEEQLPTKKRRKSQKDPELCNVQQMQFGSSPLNGQNDYQNITFEKKISDLKPSKQKRLHTFANSPMNPNIKENNFIKVEQSGTPSRSISVRMHTKRQSYFADLNEGSRSLKFLRPIIQKRQKQQQKPVIQNQPIKSKFYKEKNQNENIKESDSQLSFEESEFSKENEKEEESKNTLKANQIKEMQQLSLTLQKSTPKGSIGSSSFARQVTVKPQIFRKQVPDPFNSTNSQLIKFYRSNTHDVRNKHSDYFFNNKGDKLKKDLMNSYIDSKEQGDSNRSSRLVKSSKLDVGAVIKIQRLKTINDAKSLSSTKTLFGKRKKLKLLMMAAKLDILGQSVVTDRNNAQQVQSFSGIYHSSQSLGHHSQIREVTGLKISLEMSRQIEKHDKKVIQIINIEKRAFSNQVFNAFYLLSVNSYFIGFLSIVTIFNTILLATDYYPSTSEVMSIIEKGNILCSLIFIIEMIIKLLGMGLVGYFKDSMNIFLTLIVISSIVDIAVSYVIQTGLGSSIVTLLRAIRLLRVFKLAKTWMRLRVLLRTILRTAKDIASFTVLLSLVIFIYTLLGLELFGCKAKFDKFGNVDNVNGVSSIYNFDTFINALTTVFIVLTNDSWQSMFYMYSRAVNQTAATLFFISLVIIGQKVLLNLFLAILLENFDESQVKQQIKEQLKTMEQKEQSSETFLSYIANKLKELFNSMVFKVVNYFENKDCNKRTVKLQPVSDYEGEIQSQDVLSTKRKTITIEVSSFNDTNELKNLKNSQIYQFFQKSSKSQLQIFREKVKHIIETSLFRRIVFLIIVISMIHIILDTPLSDPNSSLSNVLEWLDIATTILFGIETFLKIFAYGFLFNGSESYLRNPWNIVDFLVFLLSVISIPMMNTQLHILKMLRLGRLFLIIQRNDGLQIALHALIKAIPSIVNVLIILMLFGVIIGIILVSYFKGQLHYCQFVDQYTESQVMQTDIISKWNCLNSGSLWKNRDYNFDNIGMALVTLFIMGTTASWSDTMFNTIIASEIDYAATSQIRSDYSILWRLFFIGIMIIGGFFFINLFVGVVISSFTSEKDSLGGYDQLSIIQKEWIETRQLILKSSPIKRANAPLHNTFRHAMYRLHQSRYFNILIQATIVINALVQTVQWYRQPVIMNQIQEAFKYIATAIFTIEALIKILAMGKFYFHHKWNIFDFSIVAFSILCLILSFTTNLDIGGATTIVRMLRILRLLRLWKGARSLRMITNTFIHSLPALFNLGSVLVFFIFIYSIIGLHIFGALKRTGMMNDHINFETFGNAFITLFIVSTGDYWNLIMNSFAQPKSESFYCICNPTFEDYKSNGYVAVGCGDFLTSLAFFLSFFFGYNLVFLKLFIAIVLQGFSDIQRRSEKLFNHDMLEYFREVWSQFDPQGTSFIKISDLVDLLTTLGEPLGFTDEMISNRLLQDKFIAQLELPIYNDFSHYQYMDVLDALSIKLMAIEEAQRNQAISQKEQNPNQVEELKEELPNQTYDENKKSVKIQNIQKAKSTSNKSQLSIQALEESELKFKNDIEKEITNLMERRATIGGPRIQAFEEVLENRRRAASGLDIDHKEEQLTSMHQAAAQVVIDNMRRFVAKKKTERFLLGYGLQNKQAATTMKAIDEDSIHSSHSNEEEEKKHLDNDIEFQEEAKTSISNQAVVQSQCLELNSSVIEPQSIPPNIDPNWTNEILIIQQRKSSILEAKIQESMQQLAELQLAAERIKNDQLLIVSEISRAQQQLQIQLEGSGSLQQSFSNQVEAIPPQSPLLNNVAQQQYQRYSSMGGTGEDSVLSQDEECRSHEEGSNQHYFQN